MSENVAVLIRVGLAWRAPEPGGAPDQRLVKALPGMWPKPLRADKGLIVEAGRQERREGAVDRARVEGERRPAVLAVRLETLIQLDLRRAQVRRCAATAAHHGHERVRLLRARGEDPARAMILERAPDEVDAIGEKRGGERVASVAHELAPIEPKRNRPVAFYSPALWKPECLVHELSPPEPEDFVPTLAEPLESTGSAAGSTIAGRGSPTL